MKICEFIEAVSLLVVLLIEDEDPFKKESKSMFNCAMLFIDGGNWWELVNNGVFVFELPLFEIVVVVVVGSGGVPVFVFCWFNVFEFIFENPSDQIELWIEEDLNLFVLFKEAKTDGVGVLLLLFCWICKPLEMFSCWIFGVSIVILLLFEGVEVEVAVVEARSDGDKFEFDMIVPVVEGVKADKKGEEALIDEDVLLLLLLLFVFDEEEEEVFGVIILLLPIVIFEIGVCGGFNLEGKVPDLCLVFKPIFIPVLLVVVVLLFNIGVFKVFVDKEWFNSGTKKSEKSNEIFLLLLLVLVLPFELFESDNPLDIMV